MRHRERGDLLWIAGPACSVPPALLGAAVVTRQEAHRIAGSVVVFAPLTRESLGADIRDLRRTLGERAYLVIVVEENLGSDWFDRALDLGADDVLSDLDDSVIARCLSRARKAQERTRRAEDEVGHVALERDYLQACIDHLPTPIFFKNVEGVYVGCNSAFAEYLGLPLETILGASVYDVAPAEIARRYQAADDALFDSGGVQVYESKVCHSNGDMRFVEFQKAVIKSRNQGVYGIAGAILDITDRKRLETQLIDAAERDPLTNAYNRRKFFQLAEDAAEWARNGASPVSVAIIDVDQFKLINDRLGHSEGDNVLRTVSQVLEATIGEDNIVARAGGEEFYALFPGLSLKDAAALADDMRREVERFCRVDVLSSVAGTVSIGLARFDANAENLDDALKRADTALYLAKREGRNQIRLAV
ncbi:MAG: sensor domain-containing diguanylate cyclase [Shinella sp.]|nr:MAG: sensor domain-containing diguanylate cyclase [Shinella sp.]